MEMHKDVWSSGQMGSKLWLCEELEKIEIEKPMTVWVLGGWCGLLSQLLLARNKFPIERIRSFDIDPACEPAADTMNNLWVWKEWKFKAFTTDCNQLSYDDLEKWASGKPDLVINTSTEHFTSLNWWERIPKNTMCAFQSTNMKHDDHSFKCESEEELSEIFPLDLIYKGKLSFDYKNDSSFSRFMVIGRKL